MNNRLMKGKALTDMAQLLGQMSHKFALLEVLDRDSTEDGSYDLYDQLTTMQRALARLEETIQRAKRVNGLTVDEEYNLVFGENNG